MSLVPERLSAQNTNIPPAPSETAFGGDWVPFALQTGRFVNGLFGHPANVGEAAAATSASERQVERARMESSGWETRRGAGRERRNSLKK
jgi:hypothetical protein